MIWRWIFYFACETEYLIFIEKKFDKKSHACYKFHIPYVKNIAFSVYLHISRNLNVFRHCMQYRMWRHNCLLVSYSEDFSVKITSSELYKMDKIRYFTTENGINLSCHLFEYLFDSYDRLPSILFFIKLLSRWI